MISGVVHPVFFPETLFDFTGPGGKGGCVQNLPDPGKGPGVVLRQVTDVVFKIQLGPHTLPQTVHEDRLTHYQGQETPEWIGMVRQKLEWVGDTFRPDEPATTST